MTIQRCAQFAMSILLLIFLFTSALAGCSPRDQALLQTQVAQGAQTAMVVAQTEAVKGAQTAVVVAQTEAVKGVQTGVGAVQTHAIAAANTAIAEKAKSAATQAVQLKQTAAAELTRNAPKPGGAVIDYFALGDSIASGHGLMDDGTPCHRSPRAYPHKVAQMLKASYQTVNFTILACSGASAGKPKPDVLAQDKYKWLRNQVDDALFKISDRPTLVTINIGANDFGWASPSIIPHYAELTVPYLDWVKQAADQVAQELIVQVKRLLERKNVGVVITQLYNPFNKSSLFFTLMCNDALGTLSCYERTEYGVQALNNAYVLDVYVPLGRPERLKFALSNPSFYGHEAPQPGCGRSAPGIGDTWIQYPGDPASNGAVPDLMQRITGHPFGDCFHPNEKGAQAFAEAVMNAAMRIPR